MKKKIYSGKIPNYVEVYNSLYLDIVNGVYSVNEHLPSEKDLTEKYNVSRNTLRKALSILKEDGIITKSQGKGTTVSHIDNNQIIERMDNLLIKLCKKEITETKINYNYNPPTDIAAAKLGVSKSDLVLASNCVCKSNNQIVGYSFNQISTNFLEDLNVNINNEHVIKNLVIKDLFDFSVKSSLLIQMIKTNEIEVEFLKIPLNTNILMIESILYNEQLHPYARCKFYFIPEFYTLKFFI